MALGNNSNIAQARGKNVAIKVKKTIDAKAAAGRGGGKKGK